MVLSVGSILILAAWVLLIDNGGGEKDPRGPSSKAISIGEPASDMLVTDLWKALTPLGFPAKPIELGFPESLEDSSR